MERVLLLNVTYEPIGLLSHKRAVVLTLTGKAEVVKHNRTGICFRSEKLSITLPSIVKLTYYVHVPYKAFVPPLTRKSVLKRDGFRCAYCAGPADTIDHVVPRSRGGAHVWSNVVASCKKHNILKGDKLLAELGWTLRFVPDVPKAKTWFMGHPEDLDPAWRPYLTPAG
jgi:5-methylcytosine-specific restriction endonuclease McrA